VIAEVVKSVLIPGSVQFLLLGLGLGVVLLHAGKAGMRWGRRWLTLLALLYLVLALPLVSNALIAGLEPDYTPIRTKEDARGASVVAVIGNGVVTYASRDRAIQGFARRTAFAVLEAVRIHDLIQPSWMIASGGIPNPSSQTKPESEVMRDELVRLGVPSDRILLESGSRNTAEQTTNIAALLREKGLTGPVVLVTTPAHSRRVLMLAGKEGIDLVLGVADELRYDEGGAGWQVIVPTTGALVGSASAVYEYIAVAHAWFMEP
jgi:uncharacterized SAM-binding protein YcdF (DUF218 family)